MLKNGVQKSEKYISWELSIVGFKTLCNITVYLRTICNLLYRHSSLYFVFYYTKLFKMYDLDYQE